MGLNTELVILQMFQHQWLGEVTQKTLKKAHNSNYICSYIMLFELKQQLLVNRGCTDLTNKWLTKHLNK